MEKVELRTADVAAENAAKLAELFPDIVTEVRDEDGSVRHSIDVEALKAHVGDVAEDKRERYQFTWPGKQKARAEAIRAIDKTMRPCPEESVNWGTTENLYIEGDNLDALKILRETYAGKIKMIYIDPPYNTGHDFIYKDSRRQSQEDMDALSSIRDDEGNQMGSRFELNSETSGTFHSDWCSMMYERLLLAKDLLHHKGLLLSSIDERELSNLLSIMDEIYGQKNRLGIFKWNKTSKAPTLSKLIRNKYEYVVAYRGRDLEIMRGPDSYNTAAPLFNSGNGRSKVTFPAGSIDCAFSDGAYFAGVYGEGEKAVVLHNDLIVKNGVNAEAVEITGRFKWTQSTVNERVASGQRFMFKKPTLTTLYYYLDSANKFIAPSDVLNKDECGVLRNDEAYSELNRLLGFSPFDYSKPVSLVKYLVRMIVDSSSIVLDFFSGSATTAHAVMQLNAEDGGNRKFIMVQLPEVCDEKSEAAKAGYKNICEIGKERIRRAGAKIAAEVEESNAQLKLGEEPKRVPDIGFRVLKIDSSNFEDVQRTPGSLRQDDLFGLADNVKPGRTPEDILFQLFPKMEIPYTARVDKLEICGKTVYSVDDDTLVACFDREVPEDVVRAMAEREPAWAVLRDASFTGDDALANFEEIFKTVSPETKTRVV